MEVEIRRKLVLTYLLDASPPTQRIEMKFGKRPRTDCEVSHMAYLKEICDNLNGSISRLVDGAKFHIVEVKIIK